MKGPKKINARLLEIIYQAGVIPTVDQINRETRLREDLQLDQLDVAELSLCLEDEYDIQIKDEDMEKVHTVGDLVEHIKKLGVKF